MDAPRTVGELIRARRTQLGWSLQKLGDLLSCAKSYVSEIETGKRALPSEDVLAQIEQLMMMPEGSLVERARWEKSLKAGGPTVGREIDRLRQENQTARRLADLVREHAGNDKPGLDELYRSGRLHKLIGDLSPADNAPPQPGLRGKPAMDGTPRPSSSHLVNIARLPRKLPVDVPLINSVSAGYPREFTDLAYPARVADEYVKCPDVDDPDAFAARVVGDSMMPDYRQGEVIVFSPARMVKSGNDCFVRLERDAETTFKRVYFESGPGGEELIRLQPINNAYSPKVFPREDIAGLYVAVKAIREI